jgi:prophage regulatory protein
MSLETYPSFAGKKTSKSPKNRGDDGIMTNNKLLCSKTHKTEAPSFLRANQIIGCKKKGINPLVPVCSSTFYQWVRDGKFPKPIKLGEKTTVWRSSDVYQWIEKGGHI